MLDSDTVGHPAARRSTGGSSMKARAFTLAMTLMTITCAVWVLAAPWKI